MNDILIIRNAEPEDLNTIGHLAYQIWPIAYKDILTLEQLHYMLEYFYSPKALKEQMFDKHHVFLIAETEDDEPIGFASYSLMEEGTCKLHKLYVLPNLQKKNVGKSLLDVIEQECQEAGGKKLILNVNRFNNARLFYEKRGFKVIKEEDVDIGNGFVQEDYVMGKEIDK